MEEDKSHPTIKKVIPVAPKRDSQNSRNDRKAISTLYKILSDHDIDAKLAAGDTTPNYDGMIDLDEGKIEVQVKYKLFNDGKPIKYSIKDHLLSHCENCSLPFIFILVDPVKNTAYWEYISRDKSIELYGKIKPSKHSISHRFSETNIIRHDQTEFIESWRSFCKVQRFKLHNYDNKVEELKKTEEELKDKKKLLKKFNPAIGESRQIFSEIHRFLDIYNGLLDREFFAYKTTNHENTWKIGLAYIKYERDSAQFILYSINHQKNDVQIKRISNEEIEPIANDIISYNGFDDNNPIRNNPIEYSYQLINDDLIKIFNMKDLYFIDGHIADEYLMRFIQKFTVLLGIEPNQEKIMLEDFERRFNEYIPLWLDQAIKMLKIETYNTPNRIPIVFEHFIKRHEISQKNIKKITQVANKQFEKGEYSPKTYPLGSAHSSIDYIRYIIQFCKDIGKKEINGVYTLTNKPLKSKPKAILQNVKLIFQHLPETYSRFVQQYFPLLAKDLWYFKHFDKLIVSINSGNDKDYNWDLTLFFLKGPTPNNNDPVEVYYSDELPEPLLGHPGQVVLNHKEKQLVLNDISYKIIGMRSQSLVFDYEQVPQRDLFYKTLVESFEKYFKEKTLIKKDTQNNPKNE